MWVRLRAVEALGLHSDRRAVEPVNSILADKNELVRQRAAEVLGQLCDGRSVGPLIDVLTDKNKLVRRNAAEALGLIGDRQAVEALEKTELEDESPDVRTVAAGALKSIRSKAAREDRANASNGKQVNPIIEKLVEIKIYIGAGFGVFLLLVGLTIVLVRRRKRFLVRPAEFH
jgi:HEAT repeat protein